MVVQVGAQHSGNGPLITHQVTKDTFNVMFVCTLNQNQEVIICGAIEMFRKRQRK